MLDRLAQWLGLVGAGGAAGLAAHERVLLAITVGVIALFVLTLIFALVVVALRAGHLRRRRRDDELESRWHDPLLEVLGGAPAERLRVHVRAGEELAALGFLLRFARRLRGDESRILAGVAQPWLPYAARELRSRSPERRALGAQMLAAFGLPRHTGDVLRALDDRSPFVAMIAAQALARREHATHASQVVQRLWRFADWSEEYLAGMLARVGPAVAEPTRLVLADRTQRPQARAVAAEVLRRLSDPPGADLAAAALQRAHAGAPTSHVPLHVAALALLAQVGRPEHLDVVRPFARSSAALVRAAAMRALATLGGRREADTLVAALHDPSPWVARESAHGLARLGRVDLLRRHAASDAPGAVFARQALSDGGHA